VFIISIEINKNNYLVQKSDQAETVT